MSSARGAVTCRDGFTVQVRVHNRRMDVTLPAHRFRIAQAIGHRLHGSNEIALGRAPAAVPANQRQTACREDRPGPGAKVLRREVLPRDAANVAVDVS
jgi:hypothetical protein